jgi:hypothetical protein
VLDGAGQWPYFWRMAWLGILLIGAGAIGSLLVGIYWSHRGRRFDSAYWLGWVLGFVMCGLLVWARHLGVGGP